MKKNNKAFSSPKTLWLLLLLLFSTAAATQAQTTIQIGSGGTSNYLLPIYANYGYNYTQQIYTKAEIEGAPGSSSGAKIISKIQFKLSGTAGTFNTWKNWTVFLGNTTKSAFPSYSYSASDWVPVSAMTQVFSGEINGGTTPTSGAWFTISITPFLWDGTSNLVVAIDENSASYSSVSYNSYTAPSSAYAGMYYYSDGTNPDPNAPPSPSGATSTIPQVKFDIANPPACSGTPSGGSIISAMNVCTGVNFTVTATGYTTGFTGLTSKWQSSTNGSTWTDISPAVTTPSLTTSYTGSTGTKRYYRYAVTCGSNTGYSNTLTANILCYCTPTMNAANSYFIKDFSTTGGTNNISNLNSGYSASPSGVGDFTNQKVTVEKGESIDFAINTSGGTAGFKIWVDWNGDGTWSETVSTTITGEKVFQTSAYTANATGTITTPTNVTAGIYRMRVGMNYSTTTGPATSCTGSITGEYEDYSFEVIIPSCSKPTNVTHTQISGTQSTISWTAPTSPPAQGYEYYISTVNTPPALGYTGVSNGTTSFVYNANQGTTYYVWVRSKCSSVDKSSWSAMYTFTQNQIPATLPFLETFDGTVNWTFVNGTQTNKWMVGTNATGSTGKSMYISNNNSANQYTLTSASIVHAYRDITFGALPSGSYNFGMSIDWKGAGESSYDYFDVRLVPLTTTITEGVAVSGGASIFTYKASSGTGAPWITETYTSIPSSYANGTYRLVFSWRNDASGGAQPPAAIDNIKVDPSLSCSSSPTLKAYTNLGPNSAQMNWTAPSPAAGLGYEYYISTSSSTPAASAPASGFVASPAVSTTLGSLSPNTQYYVWMRSVCNSISKSSWSQGYSFTNFITPSANDECTNAVTLVMNSSLTYTNTKPGNIYGATASGQANSCGYTGATANDDVWYKFTATATKHKIALLNKVAIPSYNSTDLFAEVRTSCTGSASVLCSDDDEFSVPGLSIGTTYYVRVYSYSSGTSNIQFDVAVGTPPPPPANDECSGAVTLSVNPSGSSSYATGTLQSATASSNVPLACYGTPSDDVWYKFVATGPNQVITLNTVSPATITQLQLLSGCSGGNSLFCSSYGSYGSGNTLTATGLTNGTTYYIRVYSTGTAEVGTTFKIFVTQGSNPAPANDECATAQDLGITPTTVSGTTRGATQSVGSSTCGLRSANDVWYTVTPPYDGTLTVSISPSGVSDGTIFDIKSTCFGTSALVCGDGYYGPESITATANTTYYIRVYGFGGMQDNFTVTTSGDAFVAPDAGITAITSPTGTFCAGNQPVKVTIKNFGTKTITSATINWKVDGVAQTPYSYSGSLAADATEEVTLGTINFPFNTDVSIEAATSMPNGIADPNTTNDGVGPTNLKATNDIPYAIEIQISTSDSVNYQLELIGAERATTYTWDFGDNSAPAVFTINQQWSYLYDQPGDYLVTVTLNNECGEYKVYSDNIHSLPVEMDKLTADLNTKSQAVLSWNTFKEANNKGFQIHRSENGKDFKQISFLNSKAENGNSNEKISYSFTDQQPIYENTFYRITQEDFDGKKYNSNIVELKVSSSSALSLTAFPNPLENKVTLSIKGKRAANAKVNIIDVLGKVVKSVEITQALTELNLEKFPAGVYILKYQDDENAAIIRVNKK